VADPALVVRLRQAGPIPLDVAFECGGREMLALVGPSGSGKTTILRSISGLYRPAACEVRCNGSTWSDTESGAFAPPFRRRVGMVFQHYALFPHMSAAANVAAAMGHRPAPERGPRARELLALVGLAGLEARMPHQLSGGQQQRVAVARALARDPEALLLDEPFSAVDKATRQRLYGELGQLKSRLAMPVILVTHDFDEAARLADRMCLIDHGRLLQTGTPGDVLARPVNVAAARIVDLKNMFAARILSHDANRTWLDWNGRKIAASPHRQFAAGQRIVWAVPSTQVLLDRPVAGRAGQGENRLRGIVARLATLSESTSLAVRLAGADAPELSMTVPAHFVRRTGMRQGAKVAVRLLVEGIHIMDGEHTQQDGKSATPPSGFHRAAS